MIISTHREIWAEVFWPLYFNPLDVQEEGGAVRTHGKSASVSLDLTVDRPGRVLAERLGLEELWITSQGE